ncbi:integral membrane sensor signal transduction histidine kinase [Parafrankia sp. EAN1pec]|nr:integral membrane sensor signal transduction histidine kinase [Frankia sp. EAN1pec]
MPWVSRPSDTTGHGVSRRWSAAATAATVVFSMAAAPMIVLAAAGGHGKDVGEWLILLYTPGFAVPGLILTRRRPELVIGWMYLVAGLTTSVTGLAAGYAGAALGHGWPGPDWALWVVSWSWQAHLTLEATALFLFPSGRITSMGWRRAAQVPLALTALAMVASALRAGVIVTTPDEPGGSPTGLVNPMGLDVPALAGVAQALGLVGDLAGVAAIASILVRYVRARGDLRQQLRWVAATQLLVPVILVTVLVEPSSIGPFIAIAQTLLQQVAVVAAILRWRLYGIDVAVRRSVLAATLLTAALGTYAAVVLAVGALIGTTGPLVSAIGAAAAVFAFGPMSVSIRARINRLFYGRRDDPYAVVAAVGRQLSTAPGPEDGLHILAETLTLALRIPYAGIVTADNRVVAEHHAGRRRPEHDGDPLRPTDDETDALPLGHHGQQVGTLLIGRRRGEDRMSGADRALLGDVARQVGAAVHAVALLHDLRGARTRLVLAREDERRRLQRDLHDGLGPRLTATGLTLDAARNRLRSTPELSDELLADARAQVNEAIDDVRRLVYALGDPSLESAGLVAALRAAATRLGRGGFPGRGTEGGRHPEVVILADGLVRLPAGIETAAYRIVTEAITNTVRHAAARRCEVSLRAGSALSIEVHDDGRGLPDGWQPGVGVRSINERAADLGGQCTITSPPGGGTLVTVTIPLPRPGAASPVVS